MTLVTEDALQFLRMIDGQLINEAGQPFDAQAYSRFKHGETIVPQTYAIDLVRFFIEHRPEQALAEGRVLVTPTSYRFLPTPAMEIARTFLRILNIYRAKHGLDPAIMMHIIRWKVSQDTYSNGSKADRLALLGPSSSHMDAGLIRGSVVVALDDLKVTGVTQERMVDRLVQLEPISVSFLFVARIDPAYAEVDASIENTVNTAYVKSLAQMQEIIASGYFQMNARVCNYLVKQPEEQLRPFLRQQSSSFLLDLYDGLTCSSANMYGRYPASTAAIEEEIHRRGLLMATFIDEFNPVRL